MADKYAYYAYKAKEARVGRKAELRPNGTFYELWKRGRTPYKCNFCNSWHLGFSGDRQQVVATNCLTNKYRKYEQIAAYANSLKAQSAATN